jgi:hypothetical protein
MFLEAHHLLNFLEAPHQLKAAQGASELGANLPALASPKTAQPSSLTAPSRAIGITRVYVICSSYNSVLDYTCDMIEIYS